jgi:ATP-binding cassette subfamily B protein
MFLMIGLNIGTPLIFKKVIIILSNPKNGITPIFQITLILYGLSWAIGQIVSQLRSIMMFRLLERNMRIMSLQIFDHLHTLSLRFHLERRTGDVTSAIERAQFGFEMVFWGLLLFLLPTVLEMILAMVVLTYFYGIFYSSVLLFMLVFYLLFSILAINRSSKLQNIYNEKRAKSSSFIIDNLLNFETVKYFGNEFHGHEQCNSILQEQENAGNAKCFADVFIQLGQVLMIGGGLVYLTVMTGNAVILGQMNVSDFVLINGYLLQFVIPLHSFGYVLKQVRQGLNDMDSAINLMEIKPEIQDAVDAINLNCDKSEIKFENVVFGYDDKRQILKEISFTVPSGHTVAIVGATGAGKSTIARLIFRFYDVVYGRILINDFDIRKITQRSLHDAIGVVPQDTVLFNDTLYYNISYGCPSATKEEVERAIKLAHLDEFIECLPDGCDTMVGERGLKLSGGEKQRVAIARVILKNPQIYIFDEATSSLDTHTEQEIQKNLEEISKGATTLIVAHRLSTVIHANEIIVIDHGIIVERGTHQELLKTNGLYANLWKKQSYKKINNFLDISKNIM